MSKYDVDKVRKKLQEKQGSRFRDPNEFRPPKVGDNDTAKFRFFILPPLEEGDTCADGVATRSMGLFYIQNGSHWLNNRSHQCPRMHDEKDCPVCDFGFDTMKQSDDKEYRREVARTWLPRTQYAINIYFPKDKVNPEDVAGRVMWMNATKQLFDIWEACIMNDSEGDPADKQAFGVFYDEEASYLFQLTVKKSNRWNDYTASKFLASVGKRPIAAKDGEALPKRIKKIMDLRHDLYTKFQPRDVEALADLIVKAKSGEPLDDDGGFDKDEATPAAKPKPKPTPKPKPKPKPKPEVVEEEEELSDLGEDVAADEPDKTEDKTEPDKAAAKSDDDIEEADLENMLATLNDDDDDEDDA